MGDERFDRLAKVLSRRASWRLAFETGALVMGLSRWQWDAPQAWAAGGSDCQGLDNSQIISKNNCGITACGTRAGCVCVQTPGHHVRCAAGFAPPGDCKRKDECNGPNPCPRGQFCAKVLGCCGSRARKVCLRPCPA